MADSFVNNWKSQVKKGTLSLVILGALRDTQYYGYELIEEIKKHTEIEIAEGTLYPLLNRLKEEGLVSSKWVEQGSGIPRKYYILTKEGSRTLMEMNEYWSNLIKSIKKITK